ncbi:S1/P1 nuclease [Parasediminibacterium sp. JCM 36343]|uniref:S1/P1 nuclease n=1 Tax=Parasediminibacterium sp. JCM 36343 TaxID=3374279 RepID=UPI00397E28C4
MILKKLKQALALGLLVYLPVAAMAWGMEGHRIVGEIAESYLSPKAKLAVQKILGTESMAIASNWPDFIKSDTSYKYLNPWHYLNVKDSLTEAEFKKYLESDNTVDAYTKLNFLIKQLKDKSLPKEKQLMYLRLVIHIVGDIHQPMHVSREEDQGGNKIKLSWFGQPTNLHGVWDEKIIDYQQLSYTEYAKSINHTTAKEVSEWQHEPLKYWIYQSYSEAQKIYAEIKPDMKLSYRYNFDHIQTVNTQLLKGGVRLAGLLNEIFG